MKLRVIINVSILYCVDCFVFPQFTFGVKQLTVVVLGEVIVEREGMLNSRAAFSYYVNFFLRRRSVVISPSYRGE